jgi:hypothetical protein
MLSRRKRVAWLAIGERLKMLRIKVIGDVRADGLTGVAHHSYRCALIRKIARIYL